MSSVYEIYRSTTLGSTLDETLGELVHRQMLTPSIAHSILNIFDEIISQRFLSQSIKEKTESSLIFQGHLLSYRSCDQVWTLLFDSLRFTSSTWTILLDKQKLKIITCPTISTTTTMRKDSDHRQIKSKSSNKFYSS